MSAPVTCAWWARRVRSQDPCCCRRRTASGIDCPSCTACNCIEKGCRRAVVYRKVAWMVLPSSCRCGAGVKTIRQSRNSSRVRNPAPLGCVSCFMFISIFFVLYFFIFFSTWELVPFLFFFYLLHAHGGCAPCWYACLYSSLHACCWWCCFWYTQELQSGSRLLLCCAPVTRDTPPNTSTITIHAELLFIWTACVIPGTKHCKGDTKYKITGSSTWSA